RLYAQISPYTTLFRSWLHIDLRETKYELLLEKLGQKEFQHYVEKTLAGDNFTKEELLIYLERYRRLMGTDYRTVMFQKYDDKYKDRKSTRLNSSHVSI